MMLMGSQPKAGNDGVSRRMLIVIIALLAIIVNSDTEDSVSGYLSVNGADYDSSQVFLTPGEVQVLSYSLKAGTYEVYMYYSFQNDQYYSRSFGPMSIDVAMFETQHVHITLAK